MMQTPSKALKRPRALSPVQETPSQKRLRLLRSQVEELRTPHPSLPSASSNSNPTAQEHRHHRLATLAAATPSKRPHFSGAPATPAAPLARSQTLTATPSNSSTVRHRRLVHKTPSAPSSPERLSRYRPFPKDRARASSVPPPETPNSSQTSFSLGTCAKPKASRHPSHVDAPWLPTPNDQTTVLLSRLYQYSFLYTKIASVFDQKEQALQNEITKAWSCVQDLKDEEIRLESVLHRKAIVERVRKLTTEQKKILKTLRSHEEIIGNRVGALESRLNDLATRKLLLDSAKAEHSVGEIVRASREMLESREAKVKALDLQVEECEAKEQLEQENQRAIGLLEDELECWRLIRRSLGNVK